MNKAEKKKKLYKFLPILIPLFILSLWILFSWLKIIPVYLLPGPLNILKSAKQYIFGVSKNVPFNGRFLNDFYVSSLRVFTGFVIAVFFGFTLGLITGRKKALDKLFSSFVNGIRAVPGIAWLPLAMIWFGIGFKTTVFLILLAAFFPIYLNTYSSVKSVDEKLLQAGYMMGLSKIQRIFFILFPAALPGIVPGVRLGLGISWAYLVLGELTGVSRGLGAFIMDARLVGRVDMIIIGIILIAVIGKLADIVLVYSMKVCFKSVRRQI